jgi:peptidyl-prolyl cis-trans isomerase B (cyclophilin B)
VKISTRSFRLPAVAALVLFLAACGGGSKSASTTRDANGCIPVKSPAPTRKREARPTAPLIASKTYDVTLQTNCGNFTIRLATTTSPKATASFVSLARKGFFDQTVFHRIVPGFVIQGGDPTGTGSGGPGYTTVDPPPPSAQYTLGVAAMAKGVSEPPGAAGSQFFIVTAPDAQLPPDYAVLGKVTKGLPVVQSIGKLGDPASGNAGTPTEPVVIQKATVHVG